MFSLNWPSKRKRKRLRAAVAAVTAVCLAADLLSVVPAHAQARSGTLKTASTYAITDATSSGPHVAADKPSMTLKGKSAGLYTTKDTALPAAAGGSVALPTFSDAATRKAAAAPKAGIAGTPLWTQRVAAGSGPSGVTAVVTSQATAKALGVNGVVFELASTADAGTVRVGLDYGAFKDAYGGDFDSRLRLHTLPACALTTPQLAECRVHTPVAGATNDAGSDSLSGVVDLAGAIASQGTQYRGGGPVVDANFTPAAAHAQSVGSGTQATVLAASAGTGEEGAATGNYGATPIAPDGSWALGGSTGDFTYTYPITDPDSSGGLTPQAGLDYDSGLVDGKTAITQAQASWIGDGWYDPSDDFITQGFESCGDDPEGTASAHATDDMCYDGEVLSLSLAGATTTIVDDNGTFKLQNDTGAVLTHVTNSNKGQQTYNTDYWELTERDGTSYYFGLNELPGYSASAKDATTDSVDWEPVYSAHSGDPCYNATWADSVCNMAYEWYLDYVTDVHNDAMAYYYTQATNYYGENQNTSNVAYVRDSYLSEIDYGFTTGTGPYGLVPDKIVYNSATRCVSSTCATLSSSMSTTTAASEYPDVPTDLLCASGASCLADGPSFFSTVRLASITTEQYAPATSTYADVDTYTLTQDFPATGDQSSGTLWLESIQHTGKDTSAGGSTAAISEPSVSFSGTDLPNRWDTATFPGLYRWRVDEVTSELGSKTSVAPTPPPATRCTGSRTDTPRRSKTGSSPTRSPR